MTNNFAATDTDGIQLLLDRLAETNGQHTGGTDVARNILDVFEQLRSDSDKLTSELFDCYEHVNAAFTVTAAVGRCTTTDQAVHALTLELGQAVNSQFAYYVACGPADSPKDSKANILDRVHRVAPLHETTDNDTPTQLSASDGDFFASNIEEMTELVEEPFTAGNDNAGGSDGGVTGANEAHGSNESHDARVVTVGDMTGFDLNHDHVGRGNVLTLRLAPSEPGEQHSWQLVFVRTEGHDLFAAVNMNLAASLVRMGSAVLDRIVYAERLSSAFLQTVTALVRTIEAKDAYTSGHSARVALVAKQLGQAVGLTADRVNWLEWAGLLHDIGKIGVMDQIITKPGKLTDDEFTQMKLHPSLSYQVLEPIDAIKPALAAVRHHHERYDGSGYPDGLVAEDIPLSARILQVADVWDALTSTRSYRKALSHEKALSIMRDEAGTVLDPIVFAHFERLLLAGELQLTPTE